MKKKDVKSWLSVIEESPSTIITDLINGDYTIGEMIDDIKTNIEIEKEDE